MEAFAQKPLFVGDSIPDLAIKNVIQYRDKSIDKENVSLRNFGDKLVILDFGFTHCPGCIEKLPEMVALQEKFKKQFQFYWVTYESKQAVDDWFGGKFGKGLAGLSVPIITSDKQLHNLFPHTGEPYEVWIKDGKVIALTDASRVTDENIAKVLKGEPIDWPALESNMNWTDNKPLLDFQAGGEGSYELSHTPKYYSIVTGFIGNVAYVNMGYRTDTIHQTARYYGINLSLPELYYLTFQPEDSLEKAPLPLKKLLLVEGVNKDRYFYTGLKEDRNAWRAKNTYCYESIAPINTPESDMKRRMRHDLNYYLHLNGRVESRVTTCYSLKQLSNDSSSFVSKSTDYHSLEPKEENKYMHHYNLGDFVSQYNQLYDPILIDETRYKGPADVNLGRINPNNPDELKKALNKCGLDIVKEERVLKFFVISE
ncbi:Thiol-disulfide isomerase or thioredoxin [bacterium A37T11]|nr:Thiol-disulfide isomerase or thioredoxin [bacterium A37T11]